MCNPLTKVFIPIGPVRENQWVCTIYASRADFELASCNCDIILELSLKYQKVKITQWYNVKASYLGMTAGLN